MGGSGSNIPEWANIDVGGARRLPVYLLLDTSGSMQGAPILSVNQGVELLIQEVSADQFARDCVHVGVIEFNNEAELLSDELTPIDQFKAPHLTAGGATRLDLAFKQLRESLDRHVQRPVKGGQKGDFKPMVFVLTDGEPTNGTGEFTDLLWKEEREKLMNRPRGQIKPAAIVAVGCGPDVDDDVLKGISTGSAFRVGDSSAAFVQLFQWLSQSITSSAQQVSTGLGGAEGTFDPLAFDSDFTAQHRIP